MRDVTGAMPLGLRIRLSAMMFLQFMMFPVWFTTAVPYVRTLPGGEKWVMGFGMLMGVGTLASLASGLHDWTVPYLAAFGLSLLAAVAMSFVREESPQNGKM